METLNIDLTDMEEVGAAASASSSIEPTPELSLDLSELEEVSIPQAIETNEPEPKELVAPAAPVPGPVTKVEEPGVLDTIAGVAGEVKDMLIPQAMKEATSAAARPILGILEVSEDIANAFGADTEVIKTLIKENEGNINRWNEENPDRPINPSTIGDMVGNFVAGLAGKSAKAVAGIEGAVEFFKTLGRGEDYGEATKMAAIGSVLAGTTYKAVDYVLSRDAFSGLSAKMKEVLRSKDDTQLQEYLDMLNFAKEKDIKLFDAMIEGDLSKVQSSNLFAKDQIAKIADNFEESELKAINSIIKQEVKSFKELGDKFASESKRIRETYRAEEEALHKGAAKLGGTNTYDIRPIQEKIVNMLRSEGAENSVINAVKRELFHLERTMLPEEKATRKSYEAARKAVNNLTKKLDKAEPKQKGRYTMLLNQARSRRDKLKSQVDSYQDVNWLNTKQLMDVVKRINSDIFTKGGQSWGATDAAAKRMATMAKQEVKGFIEEMNKNNPDFLEAYKKANEKSVERFGLFGAGDKGNKDFPELAKALHTNDTEQLARSIIGSQSKFKLNMLNEVLGKELSDDFISKYVKESIDLVPGKTIRGDELFQVDLANTDRLATRLTNLVGDKDNYDFIAKNYGEQAAKDLLSLQKISNGLKQDISSVRDRVSELDKGLINYVGEKGLITGTLKIVKDGMGHIVNKMLRREPYMKTKEVEKTIKALEKHLGKNSKGSIIQKLKAIAALGIAPLAAEADDVSNIEQAEVTHTIKAGDTPESLARMYNLPLEEIKEKFGRGWVGDELNIKPQGWPLEGMSMPDEVKMMEAQGFEDKILKPHQPDKYSGLTIGYGYDLKDKSLRQIKKDFKDANIPEEKATALFKGKEVELNQEEANRLANISWDNAYRKGIKIGLPLNELSVTDRNVIMNLLYRGDLKKGSKSYRGKLYELAKNKDIEGINEFIESEDVPSALYNRWQKYKEEN